MVTFFDVSFNHWQAQEKSFLTKNRFHFEGTLVDFQYPEGLLAAAKALDVVPGEALFIGDSRNDVGAARRAGMLAGYLRGGEDSPENMALFPADIELDKLLQLPPILAGSPGT